MAMDPSEIDIVIPTIRNLDFLKHWQPLIQPYHIIVIQDGPSEPRITLPSQFNITLYTRDDIIQIIGKDVIKCISYKDSGCRCVGWLLSNKKYIITLDDDCFPVQNDKSNQLDIIHQHIMNLKRPSTPYYFNTLYDPYREGSDFVRGYPFSLRCGVETAVSHGLWLNVPDYDAMTQLVKPRDRNMRFVDAVLTVPYGTLLPMCGMNLAFNRELIGVAMYFGLMGEGQPIGRYDDMWAGWCSKVICDHLGFGFKSGLPYVWHSKASDPFKNLEKEYKGIFWQEEIVKFFQNVKFSEESKSAELCMIELAHMVKRELSKIDLYFDKLGDAMLTWVELWRSHSTSQAI